MYTSSDGLLRPSNPQEEEEIESWSAVPCQHCGDKLQPEELKLHAPSGLQLCSDCLTDYLDQDAAQESENTIEENLQTALNELPTDELLTLNLVLVCYWEGSDKTGMNNLELWIQRTKRALESKKLNAE